jgi:hypothetical protein
MPPHKGIHGIDVDPKKPMPILWVAQPIIGTSRRQANGELIDT